MTITCSDLFPEIYDLFTRKKPVATVPTGCNQKIALLATSKGYRKIFRCHMCGLYIISPAEMLSHLTTIEGYSKTQAGRMISEIKSQM